jgi:hypothetical protein
LKHYEDTDFADFTLTSSDGKDFQVHRVFLSDRSDYFKKMFTTDMKEKKAKSVTYEDIDSTTLKAVLKFIYTGEYEIADTKMAKDLLYAADRFGLTALKSICVNKLIGEVKAENALEILTVSDLFNAKDLEEKCLWIIAE